MDVLCTETVFSQHMSSIAVHEYREVVHLLLMNELLGGPLAFYPCVPDLDISPVCDGLSCCSRRGAQLCAGLSG